MGKIYSSIDGRLREFIDAQPMFFVATAPSGSDGHVNLSPKGGAGTLVVLDPLRVAYLDYTGSGAETIAHLRDNGRITLMWCAFAGPPNIVRVHGTGRVVTPSEPDFEALLGTFADAERKGLRAIIEVTAHRVSDSCGYQVPFLDYVGERELLTRWAGRKSDAELAEYRARKNARSIDGLPALKS
jgi:hypothetical protein